MHILCNMYITVIWETITGRYLTPMSGRYEAVCNKMRYNALWFTLYHFFYVLLTAHLSIILDNDQLDTHLIYFTIRLL